MELDDRKVKILNAIIQNYQETGEPVGSRTISKYTDLNLSSATIRNEMADLEEMGLIVQPHTSAGRIPTDQGYRLYVDHLMEEKTREVAEMKDFMVQRVDRLEQLLKQVARFLATNTNYATLISGPSVTRSKVKFLQLSRMAGEKLLVTVVVDGNIVKNTILDMERSMTDDDILSLAFNLNNTLNGLSMSEINLGLITKLKEAAGPNADVVEKVLEAVADAISMEGEVPIYTSGATNIFKYPELTADDTASQIIGTLEEKQQLSHLLTAALNDEEKQGIQIYIGGETSVQAMKDCSVVTATYELEDGLQGTIGIVGPKRMDYDKVVSVLKNVMAQLDLIYKKD
ncbi:MAG: heat-inducible transcription repressor HrcA [Lachnospiraceae bacterium]|jgi:heat-inducible transcriptional repressor|nr:heat-inducible transcription repressor HrcA [Lachnospiraceae bacterium]